MKITELIYWTLTIIIKQSHSEIQTKDLMTFPVNFKFVFVITFTFTLTQWPHLRKIKSKVSLILCLLIRTIIQPTSIIKCCINLVYKSFLNALSTLNSSWALYRMTINNTKKCIICICNYSFFGISWLWDILF